MHVIEALALLTEAAKDEQTVASDARRVMRPLFWELSIGYEELPIHRI